MPSTRSRRTALVLVLALTAPAWLVTPAAAEDAPGAPVPPCAAPPRDVPVVGRACPTAHGDWRVLLPGGASVLTHGADPSSIAFAESADADPTPADPACAGAAPEDAYHARVVYAHASDVASRYAERVGPLRDEVRKMTGLMLDESAADGRVARYRVLCEAGDVAVAEARLATRNGAASFDTIVSDLKALGFDDHRVKYVVYYEGTRSGIAGIGSYYADDSRRVNNLNNAPSGAEPLYAVSFGYVSWKVLMHENGHTMGAVQDGAPHASGGGHCNDGLDVMCYADGGSDSSYSTTRCPSERRFDCGGDTYFNTNPPDGSYLATKWNLGWDANRFLVFGDNDAPVVTALACAPVTVDRGEAVTCAFNATDPDGDALAFTVQWGDGSSTRVPATGTVASGTEQSASHAFDGHGTFDVTVAATDAGEPALTGAPASVAVTVRRPPCVIDAKGVLTVGLAGLQVEGTSRRDHHGIESACGGTPFTLTASGHESVPVDVDVCWLDAAGRALACHRAGATVTTGAVPEGAATARVVVQTGAAVEYRLRT